jgi:hypothetical protein
MTDKSRFSVHSQSIRKAAISPSFAIRIQGSRATPPAITLLRRWSSQALEKTRGSLHFPATLALFLFSFYTTRTFAKTHCQIDARVV